MLNLLLVGFGNMGRALYNGWAQQSDLNVIVYDPFIQDDVRLDRSDQSIKSPEDLRMSLRAVNVDFILFAVKPQIFKNVAEDLSFLKEEASQSCILSIMAGVSVKTIQDVMQKAYPVLRAMPNTPAMIGQGVTVVYGDDHRVTKEQKSQAELLLKAVGQVFWVTDEEQMHAVTAVSGSGPAYLFYFVEALAQAAQTHGISEGLANNLARQTVIGAAALLRHETDEAPSILRERVTSPGGTTESGLSILMKKPDGLVAILDEVVSAACKRSKELS